MTVANRELCQELHEMSGWDDTEHLWTYMHRGSNTEYNDDYEWEVDPVDGDYTGVQVVPAYDLGYLMRKLPPFDSQGGPLRISPTPDGWEIGYAWLSDWNQSDTPEDAACKMAMKLFKEGILTKEAQS